MLSNKKKGLKKPPKNASSSLAGAAKQDSEPQKINVLDSAAVKRELDEASIRVSCDFRLIQPSSPQLCVTDLICTGSQICWVQGRPFCEQCQNCAGSLDVRLGPQN